MRPLARSPVQLKGIFWGSDMRYFLRGAEIWLGTEYVGDISGEWLAAAVEKELAEQALSKRFQRELEPHRLGPLPAPDPPRLPRDFKAERRQARRARRKGRRGAA